MNPLKTKLCWCCNETLETSFFSKNSKRTDGLQDRCKRCAKADYEKNKEKRLSQMKQYRKNNTEKFKTYHQENREVHALHVIKQRAKKKNIEFSIGVEDIVFPKYCPILNIELKRATGNSPQDSSPSVDRIDSSRGYTKDNIQVISNLANKMKNSATPEQLILFAEWVFKTYKEEGKKYDPTESEVSVGDTRCGEPSCAYGPCVKSGKPEQPCHCDETASVPY